MCLCVLHCSMCLSSAVVINERRVYKLTDTHTHTHTLAGRQARHGIIRRITHMTDRQSDALVYGTIYTAWRQLSNLSTPPAAAAAHRVAYPELRLKDASGACPLQTRDRTFLNVFKTLQNLFLCIITLPYYHTILCVRRHTKVAVVRYLVRIY